MFHNERVCRIVLVLDYDFAKSCSKKLYNTCDYITSVLVRQNVSQCQIFLLNVIYWVN